MYILHSKQWAAYNAAAEQPISAYLGGIRSGKTICGAHVAYRFIMERPDEIGAIFSNTHKQLTKATLREFKKVLASYDVYEGKHYVTNKNPEKFFGYKSMFPDHDGVWSFCNGAQVFCFSLEMQIRGTEFGWAWGDEIQEATRDSLNVVLGRMSGSARGARTFYTLTPPRSNPEIDKLIWGKGHIPITTGTTLDNDSLSQAYLDSLESMYDELTYRREVLAQRVTLAGLNWLYTFDRTKHVSTDAQYRQKDYVYVSFDFNNNPYVCTLSHRGYENGRKFIHYFDTIVLTPSQVVNRTYIQAMAEEIRRRTPYQWDHKLYYITGDASGAAQSILVKVGVNIWTEIRDEFKVGLTQLKVARKNPTHTDSRTLCNGIFAKFPQILINPKCEELIRDCEFVAAKPNDEIMKDSRHKVDQRADLLDAMRYDLHAFNGDFIRR